MSDNVIGIFDRYAPKKTADTSGSPPDDMREPYQAVEIEESNQRVLRLRIHFSDGGIDLKSYGQLLGVYSVAPNYLDLIFTSGTIDMEGDNLRALLDDFQEERVRTVHPFDPARHKEPTKGAPVIRSIEWKRAEQVLAKK